MQGVKVPIRPRRRGFIWNERTWSKAGITSTSYPASSNAIVTAVRSGAVITTFETRSFLPCRMCASCFSATIRSDWKDQLAPPQQPCIERVRSGAHERKTTAFSTAHTYTAPIGLPVAAHIVTSSTIVKTATSGVRNPKQIATASAAGAPTIHQERRPSSRPTAPFKIMTAKATRMINSATAGRRREHRKQSLHRATPIDRLLGVWVRSAPFRHRRIARSR